MQEKFCFVRKIVVYNIIQGGNIYPSGLGRGGREGASEYVDVCVHECLCVGDGYEGGYEALKVCTHSYICYNHHHGCLIVEFSNIDLPS